MSGAELPSCVRWSQLQAAFLGAGATAAVHAWSIGLGVGCLLAGPTALSAQQVLDGMVRDLETGTPLDEVVVTVKGTAAPARTTASGRFRMVGLSAGPVALELRRVGYEPREIVAPHLPLAAPLVVTLAKPRAVALEQVVVRGSRRTDVSAALDHVLTGPQVAARAFLGEDAYRTLTRIPGVAADEMSARFRMRGAEQEEALVRLDGLTLIDPFHLKDIDGVFSLVDGQWLERVDVSAAGFGAQYGDRTAGVVEFTTREPSPLGGHLFLSASPTHVRAATQGVWPGGAGGWLVSARRGIPGLVLGALGGQASAYSPGYLDGMAKLTWSPAPQQMLSAHLLLGADHFDANMDQGRIVSQSRSQRAYGWLRWQAGWSTALRTETVVSLTDITPVRAVAFNPRYPDGVSDRRKLRQLAVRHDVEWAGIGPLSLRAGVELEQGRSSYDYAFLALLPVRLSTNPSAVTSDTSTARIAQTGTTVAGYLSPRVRLWHRLDVETGVRYDRASYAGGPRVGPRMRSRLDVGGGVALVGSWGVYSQAKGLNELDIVGGERTWNVQQATQTTAGLEWRVHDLTFLRVEGYRRIVTDPWARALNIELGFEIVPEVDDDDIVVAPTRSRAEGLDLEVEGQLHPGVRWRAGYSLSRVEDQLQDRWIPRTYDQRHAASVDVTWQPAERWSIAGAWQWHTGWPIAAPDFTRYALEVRRVVPSYDYMRLGESRLPAYNRLDLRLRRDLNLAGGTLGLNLDLVNLLNRRNVRGLSYDGILNPDGTITVHRNPLTMAPLAPIVTVSWAR